MLVRHNPARQHLRDMAPEEAVGGVRGQRSDHSHARSNDWGAKMYLVLCPDWLMATHNLSNELEGAINECACLDVV